MRTNDERRSPQQRQRDEVDFNDPHEISRWTRSLGVGEEALRAAVEAVGTSFGRVYDHVIRNRDQAPQ
jgi:hypothetical protein